MKVWIIGKYPPICGGVSHSTEIVARELTDLGHSVTVFTDPANYGHNQRYEHGKTSACRARVLDVSTSSGSLEDRSSVGFLGRLEENIRRHLWLDPPDLIIGWFL